MYNQLLKKIKEYDKITIFRHVRPDGDAMFSALAMAQYLKDNFKDKKIKLAGKEEYDVISKIEKVSDDFINDSLAIVLDTSTMERVDDKRFINAKYTIRIDHHPGEEDYTDLDIVETEGAACSENLAKIFFSKEFSKLILSNKVCKYLYCGILTDSMGFSTSSTTSDTLLIASKLALKGNLKVDELNNFVFSKDVETFKKISKIRNYLIVDNNFGYIFLDKKDLKKIGMNGSDARTNIDEIAKIKEFQVWAFFTYNDDGTYNGSLRCKRTLAVNKLASRYNGGGHKCASGVNKLTLQQTKQLIKELSILANA